MTLSKSSPRAKQRWGALALVVFILTLFGSAITLAVHEAGAFELDAVSADATDDPAGAPDDWDNICKDNLADCTLKASVTAGTSSADSSSHENDGNLNSTIFTGGGSKDGLPIAGWLWKDGAGGLPDKDNLLHAYAARYTQDSSLECPGPTGDTSGAEECSLIYFGSDRYANDGDATQAFWFLQDQVAANGAATKGGNRFTGQHTDGDLLIISEFSNGGTTSTITVYQWQGDDATGGLVFLSGGANKSCDSVPDSDPFCGIVNTNTAPTFAPWDFLDKAGSNNFRQGELFEAGINLSHPDINLDEECFSSFVAETRSSTSVTATLKDFVIGDFEVCAPELSTQVEKNNVAHDVDEAPVAPGTAVYDTATVAITGASSPDDATGSVSFYLCGPTTSATACSSASGTLVSTEVLADTSNPANANDGISGADSDAVNTTANPLTPGFYCFAVTATLTNYDSPTEFANTSSECFEVADTTTTSTAQSWVPNDSATITSVGDSNLDGWVTFTLYPGDSCSGTPLFVESREITAGTASPATVSTTNGDGDTSGADADVVFDLSDSPVTVSWRAVFASDDLGVGGSSAPCETSTGLTIDDDDEPAP